MNFSHTTIRRTTLAALLGLGIAAVAAPGSAANKFRGKGDGGIVAEKGGSDRAYRYPIDIKGQTLLNAGNASFDISGKVQDNGAVAVRIAYGQKSASGSGRLSGTTGEGSWSGGGCGGTWTAERRG